MSNLSAADCFDFPRFVNDINTLSAKWKYTPATIGALADLHTSTVKTALTNDTAGLRTVIKLAKVFDLSLDSYIL